MLNISDMDQNIAYWQSVLENDPLTKRSIRSQEELENRREEKRKEEKRKKEKNKDSNQKKDKFKKEREKTIEILKRDGVLKKGIDILDVGAGPATYAFPFSNIASKIYAIESSTEMSKTLEDTIKQKGCQNIDVYHNSWESIDLEKNGWKNRFDLSFASMCQGVGKPEQFLKLINSSKQWCFYSALARTAFPEAIQDLWKIFFSEELSYNTFDIYLPFSLLYSMGYHPKLWFYNFELEKSFSIEDAVNSFTGFMWQYIECTPEVTQVIRDYINKKSSGDTYLLKRTLSQGMMYWEV